MTKLKPCPFCGGKVHLETDLAQTKDPVFCFICDNCGAIVYMDDLIDKNKSTEAWNNRPSPWHTGTPTNEEIDKDNEYCFALMFFYDQWWLSDYLFRANFDEGCFETAPKDGLKVLKFRFDEGLMWQRIEPYKEESNGKE